MSFAESIREAVRLGRPLPLPLDMALRALTPVTRAGMALRLRERPERVDARVVSFGNLTAGGTGKTPAVIERAAREMAAGEKVAILTRGYYGALKGGPHVHVAPDRLDGAERLRIAEAFGDEPALLAMRLPGVTIVKCPDRVAGAKAAIAAGCTTLILDDGFQHVRLARDENVLVIDASAPFGNGWLLPRGTLREPMSAMGRATHVILTRCDQAEDPAWVEARIRLYAPDAPIRRTRHAPQGLWRLDSGEAIGLDWLRGREVAAACAIGNPESFVRTLTALGAVVTESRTARNHTLRALGGTSALPVVTTEKDAVRLERATGAVYALRVGMEDV